MCCDIRTDSRTFIDRSYILNDLGPVLNGAHDGTLAKSPLFLNTGWNIGRNKFFIESRKILSSANTPRGAFASIDMWQKLGGKYDYNQASTNQAVLVPAVYSAAES